MENIFLAVVTDDREYGRALSLAMLSVCRSFIISISGTDEFFEKTQKFDLVLWDGTEACDVYGGKLVYLAEKPSDVVRNIQRRKFCIYKYSTADCLVAAIFEIYESVTGRRAVNLKRQNVRLFGFISCTGGVGCTTLAAALGQELCRFQGKRTLYLSFEEIESTGTIMHCHVGLKGSGVYLYHLFKKDSSRKNQDSECIDGPFLDGYLVRDDFGMEAFAPTQGRNPLRELSTAEICRFLSSLIDSGRFEAIIMDMGTWLSKESLACMEMAEKLCFVTSYRQEIPREEQYISHLVSHCGESMLLKTIRVSNMMPEQERPAAQKEEESYMLENHMDISRCRTITKDGEVRRITLEGAFGSGISQLTKRLTEPSRA